VDATIMEHQLYQEQRKQLRDPEMHQTKRQSVAAKVLVSMPR
jgi:hypothetical protein